MNATKYYFEEVQNYRTGLRDIHAKYDKELAKIEQYKGSTGYEEERNEIEENRANAVKLFQSAKSESFMGLVNAMRKTAKSRTMIAPTADELSLLQALKMRESIGIDELEQAARTLKGCPVGLSILDEIAEKNGIHGVHFGAESTESILNHINALEDNAKRLCALDRCDSRQEMLARRSIHSPEHRDNALYSFTVDRDFNSEADALSYLGGVNDLASFKEAVND